MDTEKLIEPTPTCEQMFGDDIEQYTSCVDARNGEIGVRVGGAIGCILVIAIAITIPIMLIMKANREW